jgi:hypothetical protein
VRGLGSRVEVERVESKGGLLDGDIRIDGVAEDNAGRVGGGGRYEEEGSSDWVEGGKSEAWDSLGTRVEEGCEEENAEEGWECCRPPLPSALMTAWTVSV